MLADAVQLLRADPYPAEVDSARNNAQPAFAEYGQTVGMKIEISDRLANPRRQCTVDLIFLLLLLGALAKNGGYSLIVLSKYACLVVLGQPADESGISEICGAGPASSG